MTDDEEHASLLKTRSAEAARLGALYHETPEVANLRLWWGLCYANAMGVCGIVLVALGSTLSALAADCGTTETAVGTVFIARGIGAITGALGSARLYAPPRRGNAVMVVVLLLLSVVLLYMPFVRDVWVLHATWFLLGACTATLDTGCQIMTRKVHGVHAGPWLGANTVCFAIAGALVPLIEIVTGELFAQYATLATISVLNGAALYAAPHPESPDVRALLPPRVGVPGGKDGRHARGPYHLEIIFGGAVFWLIGGKVDCTSYISTYVRQTGVVAASKASLSVLVLWIAITVGRLVGLQDQINLKKQPTRAIFAHLAAWLLTGTVGMFATAVFPAQPWAFWTGVALYGLGNGPCVGYCYDLVNRMTVATEEGMSIVMFGLNFGASLVPYLTTVIWDYTSSGPGVLIWVTLLSMFIPMPLLVAAAMVGKVD
mmetsp:Transcript_26104/g.67692  ORF Transcript_26104/g.67692 Transcript_26104/m.67692 type:complete len:430 (+) Transcript_26104:62-1351(+)